MIFSPQGPIFEGKKRSAHRFMTSQRVCADSVCNPEFHHSLIPIRIIDRINNRQKTVRTLYSLINTSSRVSQTQSQNHSQTQLNSEQTSSGVYCLPLDMRSGLDSVLPINLDFTGILYLSILYLSIQLC